MVMGFLCLRSRLFISERPFFFSVLIAGAEISAGKLTESLSHMRLLKTKSSCASMRRLMAGSRVVYRVLFACVITIRRRQQKQPINSRMVKTGPGHLTLLDQTHGMSVCHRNIEVSRRVIFSTATGCDIQRGHDLYNPPPCCFAFGFFEKGGSMGWLYG